MIQQQSISLEDARKIIAAASKKAQEIGQPMNIAVACAGGHLLAFERMPGDGWAAWTSLSRKRGPPGLSTSRLKRWERSASRAISSSAFTRRMTAK